MLNKRYFPIFQYALYECSCRYRARANLPPFIFSLFAATNALYEQYAQSVFLNSGAFLGQVQLILHSLHNKRFWIFFCTFSPPADKKTEPLVRQDHKRMATGCTTNTLWQ
jgi:hypothetical protein